MTSRARWLLGAAVLGGVMAACGGSSGPPAARATASSSAAASSQTPAVVVTTAALQSAAAAVFPPCVAAACASHGAKFTTCDSGGLSGSTGAMGDTLATCPLTPRLKQQLEADTADVTSAPDPLGGGQDEEFMDEAFTAEPSASGGVVHVVLSLGGGYAAKTDLVFVSSGGKLVLDDVYCTGKDPSTTDAYAAGWLARATCSA